MDLTVDLRLMPILVVDDEPFQRRVLREVLKSAGFLKVSEADCGAKALPMISTNNFRLVLSDVQMADMNGLELLRQIRAGRSRAPRDFRFIILTSFSNTEVLGAAMALDVNGFMVKPIKIGVVMEKIGRAVGEAFNLRTEKDYESILTDLPSLQAGQQKAADKDLAAQPLAVAKIDAEPTRKQVALLELRKGMRLATDITAKDGTLLLSSGHFLTELTINRLFDLSSVLAEEQVWVSGADDGDQE